MRFSDLKDIHQQNAMRTTKVQSDFFTSWQDANGINFADGVLGGLMENINKLSEDAAAAAVQQQIDHAKCVHHTARFRTGNRNRNRSRYLRGNWLLCYAS